MQALGVRGVKHKIGPAANLRRQGQQRPNQIEGVGLVAGLALAHHVRVDGNRKARLALRKRECHPM